MWRIISGALHGQRFRGWETSSVQIFVKYSDLQINHDHHVQHRFLSKITKTSSDSPPFETISCGGGCQTHAVPELGQRVEQSWPYYFLCRRLPDTRCTRLRPARRAELALLFLLQEAARHGPYQNSAGTSNKAGLQRVEQSWPYYFLCRRGKRGEEEMRRGEEERKRGGRTRLKSGNPNTEGREKLPDFVAKFSTKPYDVCKCASEYQAVHSFLINFVCKWFYYWVR